MRVQLELLFCVLLIVSVTGYKKKHKKSEIQSPRKIYRTSYRSTNLIAGYSPSTGLLTKKPVADFGMPRFRKYLMENRLPTFFKA
jgi:hypothetical protein